MSASAMCVRALGPGLGAEVDGISLSALDETDADALLAALGEHRVLVVREQDLTPAQQVEFSARLGPIYRMPYVRPLEECADVIAVLKEADERNVSTFGSWWHADFSYLKSPPVFSVLHARELPPSGGDTLFADMIGAFETLSAGLRRALAPLEVMHSGHIYGRTLAGDGGRSRMRGVVVSTGHAEAEVERAHPLVRLHPPTGRSALFANPTYSTRLGGMTVEESRPLLSYLYEHCARPELVLRQRWRCGDVLIWDNRAVTHLAVNDYDGHRRLLHRTTAGWERPRAAVAAAR